MKLNKVVLLIIVGIIALSSFTAVKAAPTGASITTGTQETWTAPPAGSLSTEGGNITSVNVSSYQVTDKWAGFWGNVSGGIRLADSSGDIFYQWTVSNPTDGVVYACNGTVSDWGTLVPLNVTSGYLPSFLLQGTDSFNYTFTNQETFTSPSLTVNNVNYTTTYQGGAQGTEFKTYALAADSGATLIWAGKVNAGKTTFNSAVGDYQILAGVNSQTSPTTFYFYLELP